MLKEVNLINEDFEGYHITSELDSHTFSPTFLGERIAPTTPHQRVIIKLLAATPCDPQRQQEILHKIAVLQTLQHPHILPIIAAGIHKDMPYIMTKYQPSGSLYDRLQRQPAGQPVPLEEAFLMLAQVGQALQYAHQHQVIHGYVKPQNVLLTLRKEALVTDFQRHILLLSHEVEEMDMPEACIYRAPEQLTGHTSAKSDQYALGGLAYTLFTGQRPFMVPSLHTPGTYYKTRALIAPRRLNSALPLHIEEAILKAMARDPGQRYEDVAAFLTALKLPLAAGNREMRETIVTLARIMQEEEVSDLPTTPMPEADKYKAVKKLTPADRVKQGAPFTFPIFGAVPADMAGQDGTITVPDAKSTPTLDNALHSTNLVILNTQHPYGVISNKTSFPRVKKSMAARPRRTFALIVCLLALIIIFVTTLVNLNLATPAKKMRTDGTTTINSAAQTGTLAPVGTKSGTSSPTSSVIVSAQKAPPKKAIATPAPKARPTTVPTTAPTATRPPTPLPLQVVLSPFFNNKGTANAVGQANFDGTGYSYPANQLPAGGSITLQGIPYQFPGNGPGINDNMIAFGQTIPLTPGHYRRAFLLVSSSWGPVSSAITIKYTDGSLSTQPLTAADWYSNTGVLNATYRFTPIGIDIHPVCIYAIPLELDATRLTSALTMPTQFSRVHHNGLIHIFAMTLLA
jgi:hypothetical protein